jgi:hypothetical protein
MRKAVYLILSALLLSACATTQTPNSELTMAKAEQVLVKGTTTKTDVIKAFGEPNTITKNTQMQGVAECWIYSKFSTEFGANWASMLFLGGIGGKTSMKGLTLMIYFDDKEVVKDYSITKTQY